MLKLALMVALLGSTVMADGDMGNGKSVCTVNCPPPLMASQPVDDGTETVTVTDTIFAGTDLAIDFVRDALGLF